MKKALVSIWYQGIRTAFLVDAEVLPNGSTRISESQLDSMLKELQYIPGTTYSIGA